MATYQRPKPQPPLQSRLDLQPPPQQKQYQRYPPTPQNQPQNQQQGRQDQEQQQFPALEEQRRLHEEQLRKSAGAEPSPFEPSHKEEKIDVSSGVLMSVVLVVLFMAHTYVMRTVVAIGSRRLLLLMILLLLRGWEGECFYMSLLILLFLTDRAAHSPGERQLEDFHNLLEAQHRSMQRMHKAFPIQIKSLIYMDVSPVRPSAAPTTQPSQPEHTTHEAQPLPPSQHQKQQVQRHNKEHSNDDYTVKRTGKPQQKETKSSSNETHHHRKQEPQQTQTQSQPLPKKSASTRGNKLATNGAPESQGVAVQCVSLEELESAPQYVRGCMKIDKLCAVTDRLSAIATNKYAIMRKPNSALTPEELSLRQEFKNASCAGSQ